MSVNRRQLLISASVTPALAGCDPGPDYAAVAAALWSPAPPDMPEATALLHYASLAANSHNTQPWRFAVSPDAIEIRADRSRATPAVDPDFHHLFASLGCAAETMQLAATTLGRSAEIGPLQGDSLTVALGRGPATADPLAGAILNRQSSRTVYDGHPVAPAALAALEAAAALAGTRAILITDRVRIEQALEMIVAGNSAQLADRAFVAELIAWVRFDAAEAIRTRDGLFAGATGTPEMPRWLGRRLVPWFLRPGPEGDKIAERVRSSAGLAVIVSDRNDPAHWVTAGRAAQRFALQATALGLRQCFLNQPVEVAALRPEFARWLGLGPAERPDLILRFGTGPAAPRSLRRPVGQVLASV